MGRYTAVVHRTSQPMAVVLKIDSSRRVVYSAFYGKVSDAEFLQHRSAIRSDPDFKPHFNEIVDFTAVTETSLSEAALATLAARPSLFDKSVLHIVVASADWVFQMAGKYKSMSRSSRPNFHIVRSREEAYQLLSAARGGR